MAKIPFPAAFFGMTSVFRLSAPAGLYAYRHVQSLNLLDFPDLANGDLSHEQRRAALRGMVAARPPLTALSVFLNIVALEDLIREMGSGFARLQWVRGAFSRVDALAPGQCNRSLAHLPMHAWTPSRRSPLLTSKT
jgi:hypothetical protein